MTMGSLPDVSLPSPPSDGVTPRVVLNPATGRSIGEWAPSTSADLEEAVNGAARAQASLLDPEARRALLEGCAATVRSNLELLAAAVTAEVGKTLDEARREVQTAGDFFAYYAALAWDDYAERHGGRVRYEPRGTTAAIVPWNYPVSLMASKIAPSVAAGGPVVVKPAPSTARVSSLFVELLGGVLPPGVLAIVLGDADLGDALVRHTGISQVAFTGGDAAGRAIAAACGQLLRPVTLELGGNDPAIALEDLDPALVAASVLRGALWNAGQTCVAIKRLYVPRARLDSWTDALGDALASWTVGDGATPGVDMGPVHNSAQVDRYRSLLTEAERGGGRVLAAAALEAVDPAGFFVAPVLVSGLAMGAELETEEQFLPILPVIAYDEVGEAVARANAGPFGLGASVWGHDAHATARVRGSLVAGTVWVNQHGALVPDLPFGGVKDSGIGHERGPEGRSHFVCTIAHPTPVTLEGASA